MDERKRRELHTMVRGAYMTQKLRIQTGLRIVANFKAKLGQEPGKRETTLDTDAAQILRDLRACYKKLTDGVATFPRAATFKGQGVIDSYIELCLIDQYVALERIEKRQFVRIGHELRHFPIWTEYLQKIVGVGPAMGGVLITTFRIEAAKYVSSMWAYAGLDVAPDGKARSRRKEHLIDKEYTDRNGQTQTRKSTTFNPWLQDKLIGALAPSFIKQGAKCSYTKYYYERKHRLEHHAKYGTHNDGKKTPEGRLVTCLQQRHSMAVRWMLKVFIAELYHAWKDLEGLPKYSWYSEDKLGLKHRRAV